jgi:type IV pilus assembly protein PilC
MALIVTPGQLKQRAELYYQLGSMISAGVPLLKALEMISANPAIRVSRKIIFGLISRLEAGMTFSDSMVELQGWLPEFDIALLSAGEKSGRLDSNFRLLAAYYSSRSQIIRDTISGLATTMLTFHVFLIVFPLGYLISFAQGIMNSHFDLCIPFLVEKAVAFGILYGTIFFFVFAGQGMRGRKWRSIVEHISQSIPIFRKAQKFLVLSRLSGALEALISAGVPIIGSWELAAAASGSPYLQRRILGWKDQLESGTTPGELINHTRYFPEMFANLYNTAEESGKLDDALERLRAYYQEEGFRVLRFFTYVMNGTIYGLLVLLVAYNVIKFYIGYFNSIFTSF